MEENNPKKMLEAAIDAARSAEPDRIEMEDRAARVWSRIAQSPAPSADYLRGCDDYRALIPDYIAGRLPNARALLFKDHTHECVACRNALNAARGIVQRPTVIRAERRFNRTAALLATAAALIIGVVLQQAGYLNFLLPVVKVSALARTIDGRLYRIADLSMDPVVAGEAVKAGEAVRTAADSRAVIELGDGTRIEMRERSQLSLAGTHDGVRINLDRGSVIVEAAKQRNGHLYVGTDDCTVSVVGTVFAVSAGVKGSRVSVLEGEVHVSQSSTEEKAIFPGQQLTTSPSLTPVSIEDEISWSRNLDTHLALLRALADVNKFLAGKIPGPQLRFTSQLLPLVPANTVVYGAFPNLSSVLGQAYDLFRQKINQDGSLSTWWAQTNARRNPTDVNLEEMIGHVRNLGNSLGDEIAIAVTGSRNGPEDVIVLSNPKDASAVLSAVNTIASRTSSPQHPMRVLTDAAQLATFKGDEKDPVAYVDRSLLVMASSPRAIYNIVLAQRTGKSSFAGQPFYSSITQVYSKGAGTLFAVDLATVVATAFPSGQSEEARFVGLSGAQRLVVEQKQFGNQTMTKAQLNFNGQRSGIAGWLGQAGPMGALEFVSPQAYGIASFITKDAAAIVDEILSLGGHDGQDMIQSMQRETGIDVRRDLAEPLGGELLLAMDGPLLPTPSWKVVAEVYNSARLQNTIERFVMETNAHMTKTGQPGVVLTSEAVGGQVYYRLRSANSVGAEVNYTFALGYLVAAPSRALVTQALQYQRTRSSIANSAKFRSLMPADGSDYCSAVLYQNLLETASSIASYIPSGVGGVTSDQLKSLRQSVALTPPTFVCATGEPNRIVMGYQGDLAFNVLMLGGLRSVIDTIGVIR